jgi:hypothetical protein
MTKAYQEIVELYGSPVNKPEKQREFFNDLSAHLEERSVVLFDERRARRERDWGILSHQVVGNEIFK